MADAQHIDAVARVLYKANPASGSTPWASLDGFLRAPSRVQARRLLSSTDPAVHAAMLDALVRAGVLTEEVEHLWTDPETGLKVPFYTRTPPQSATPHRRFVTEWTEAQP